MENLILITAHCPSEQHEKMLEKCIDSINALSYHILLISHTHVPLHIQKKCNYYFYDYLNDINQDEELLYFCYYNINENITIKSKYFTKEFYGFAIYRMFSIASQVAENFGYKNIHHIEYDCILHDRTLVNRHINLLKENDSVFYTDTGDEHGFLFGAFKSFKVEKLPKLFKNYDKETMRNIMVSVPLKPLESFTQRIFSESGKIFYGLTEDLKSTHKIFQNESPLRLKHFTPYYDHRTDEFVLFYKNLSDKTDNLRIFVNGTNQIDLTVEPTYWRLHLLCKSDELQSLLIILDDKIIYDKLFDQKERTQLKKNAYLILK